jgi:hypothetical protein
MKNNSDFQGLPGAELVQRGLEDLKHGKVSEFSLLLLVAKPRLKSLGIPINDTLKPSSEPVEHALYSFLEDKVKDDAYSQYNSLIRRIVSFERALEREQTRQNETGETD